ncbi:hypothetical protein ELH68_12000 [Rhizobium ruizarguesonis]|nr:hypothetical protein ELH68_12000 [Rhizobium ruizarguesonis]TBA04823.1 hypothetical protein ELH64_10560 [Rhizobium ruizarguesonis]TBA42737.1 hypothetical protein ELH62_10405 [Rhizobium ruizarguesonis]TBC35474.1 hypothetical protein ELH33_10365 [Rhizobium ruizarguesonis]
MLDRPARVVARLYGQAGRSIVSANPKGRASFRQDKGDRLGRTLGVCPSPIASAPTKICSGRMLQSDQERL